jgi:hypothetical protein
MSAMTLRVYPVRVADVSGEGGDTRFFVALRVLVYRYESTDALPPVAEEVDIPFIFEDDISFDDMGKGGAYDTLFPSFFGDMSSHLLDNGWPGGRDACLQVSRSVADAWLKHFRAGASHHLSVASPEFQPE